MNNLIVLLHPYDPTLFSLLEKSTQNLSVDNLFFHPKPAEAITAISKFKDTHHCMMIVTANGSTKEAVKIATETRKKSFPADVEFYLLYGDKPPENANEVFERDFKYTGSTRGHYHAITRAINAFLKTREEELATKKLADPNSCL